MSESFAVDSLSSRFAIPSARCLISVVKKYKLSAKYAYFATVHFVFLMRLSDEMAVTGPFKVAMSVLMQMHMFRFFGDALCLIKLLNF